MRQEGGVASGGELEIEELARRVAETEDLRAIANDKLHYCYLLDTRRPREAGAVFSGRA